MRSGYFTIRRFAFWSGEAMIGVGLIFAGAVATVRPSRKIRMLTRQVIHARWLLRWCTTN
jgi:hypothetical protein